jgi:polyisoprenyl-phosphate glycosyltransferase
VPTGQAQPALRPALSVIVPTYQGAASLAELCRRLAAVLEARAEPWELLLIDDASPDHTAEVAVRLAAAEPRLRYQRLDANVGQHRATVIGLAAAQGAILVTMDDDLQQAPESIPLLLAALRPGVQVAMGRFVESAHPSWRRAGTWLVTRALRKPAGATPLQITSFKAFRREAAEQLLRSVPEGPFYLARVMLSTLPAGSVVNVDVPHHARRHGRSNYGPLGLLRLAWRALVQRAPAR